MTVFVKVCGITTPEAAEAAASAGADALGFVHFPKSPRHLSIDRAADLEPTLPTGPLRVGVMVNPAITEVQAFAGALKLDVVQLHGHESPAFAARTRAETGLEIWKAIPVETVDDLKAAALYSPHIDRFLFDAKPGPDDSLPGGNAKSFPWGLMHRYDLGTPWLLAGGLTPETVARAVQVAAAPGVDVSSGVEDGPGKKSPPLIRAFLKAAKDAKTVGQDVKEDR